MIEQVLRTEAFYFSYSYDLTHTFQRLQNSSPEFFSKSFLERADPRFVWNRHLLTAFSNDSTIARFALPVVHGCKYVRIEQTLSTFSTICSCGIDNFKYQ